MWSQAEAQWGSQESQRWFERPLGANHWPHPGHTSVAVVIGVEK